MRKLMKLIAITAMTALLLFALVTCASADEKIYTSPVFQIPKDRLEEAEKIFEAQEAEEAAELEEAEEPGEEPGEDESLEDEAPEGEEPEEDDEDEDFEELDEDAGEVTEPAKPKHEVIIRSSQGEVVTEGDVITLTSELRGFDDDEQVEYQWQVDRGNGEGWEDVAGANKYKFVFAADRENIRYSWRLIVTIVGEGE